jgi:hypothetical protein
VVQVAALDRYVAAVRRSARDPVDRP